MTFQFDRSRIDPAAVEEQDPFVHGQWHNGNPQLKTFGALIIPTKNLPDNLSPLFLKVWKKDDVVFSTGAIEPCYIATEPLISMVLKRFTWFLMDAQTRTQTYYTYNEFKPGMRGKLHALCGVLGLDEPVVFTFTGEASKAFNNEYKLFKQRVVDPLNKVRSERPIPPFLFWMKLKSGPYVTVGDVRKSTVTRPTIVLPDVITEEYLTKIQVKDEVYDRHQSWYLDPTFKVWSQEWNSGINKDNPRFVESQEPDFQTEPDDFPG